MKLSTKCPGCEAPITLFRVMAASTPFHVKCKKCDEKIRAAGILWPTLAVSALAGLGLYLGSEKLRAMHQLSQRNGVLLLIGLGVIWEIVVGLFVINLAKLSVKEK